MKGWIQVERVGGPVRGRLVVGLLALVTLSVVGFFVFQALGGMQQLAAIMDQTQALGLRLRELVVESGPLAPLTYLVAKALTFIFLPWVGYPLNVASGSLFGIFWGFILTAAGDTLGGCILFGLSRWKGRPLVARIVGERRMARVDGVLDRGLGGWQELLFFRVVVPIPYNFVSLAAGLAPTLRFRHYVLVTFLTTAPKIFTVGIGAGLVTGEWAEVVVAGGLVVVAVAALLTRRSIRKALMGALRWRWEERRPKDGA
jgi:uncharacterized membrane protein YdjX (TVP38/TMEM64 family)